MTTEDFNVLVKERCDKTMITLTQKADEYARGDRLSNFKRIAAMRQCIPEEALLGLISKHWIATLDFVDDLNKGLLQPMPRWEEKIGDIIAYMILLEALVSERSFIGTVNERKRV